MQVSLLHSTVWLTFASDLLSYSAVSLTFAFSGHSAVWLICSFSGLTYFRIQRSDLAVSLSHSLVWLAFAFSNLTYLCIIGLNCFCIQRPSFRIQWCYMTCTLCVRSCSLCVQSCSTCMQSLALPLLATVPPRSLADCLPFLLHS
jgi:hypothetical protein